MPEIERAQTAGLAGNKPPREKMQLVKWKVSTQNVFCIVLKAGYFYLNFQMGCQRKFTRFVREQINLTNCSFYPGPSLLDGCRISCTVFTYV